jgi:gamma-glutamyl:cysteine ligase YbdK (ATP-grasp superfamily)
MYQVDKARQRAMEEVFYQQLYQRCHPARRNGRLPPHDYPMMVGGETEYIMVDEQGNPAEEQTRNRVLGILEHSSPELGTSTIETHTRPVSVVGPDAMQLLDEAQRVEQETIAVASEQGCRLVRIGSYPGPFTDLGITQEPDRYQWIVDFAHTLHGPDAPRVQIGQIMLPPERCNAMAGCQSMHINIQVPAGEAVIRMLNKSIEVVPALVALGAHSPLLNAQPSGYHEVRSFLWEPLFTFPHIDARHGVNTRRVGLPEYYYRSWDDYWRDVSYKLFMTDDIDKAFDSNMKHFWRTVRLKPCPGKVHDCLLEIRALSTQPSVEEDVAFYLLLCGLLHDETWLLRPLLPLEYVKVNFDQASKYGLHAEQYVVDTDGVIRRYPARRVVTDLLNEGLQIWRQSAPAVADLVGILHKRIGPEQNTPAQVSLRRYEHERAAGRTPAEAAQSVLLSYVVAA